VLDVQPYQQAYQSLADEYLHKQFLDLSFLEVGVLVRLRG